MFTGTLFFQIRLQLPTLNVLTTDARFSGQVFGTQVVEYGSAKDCFKHSSCYNYETKKSGKTEADLTGTDFRFPTSIPYLFKSWPDCAKGPLEPSMSGDRKKWSVKCGGRCGGCKPTSMILEIDGC